MSDKNEIKELKAKVNTLERKIDELLKRTMPEHNSSFRDLHERELYEMILSRFKMLEERELKD